MFYRVVTNAPCMGRVQKGVKTPVNITEFAVIRILSLGDFVVVFSDSVLAFSFFTVDACEGEKPVALRYRVNSTWRSLPKK